MDPMILVAVLVAVLVALVVVKMRQKKSSQEQIAAAGKSAVGAKKAPAAEAIQQEDSEQVIQEDWGWDDASPAAEAVGEVASTQELDTLTEYKVYKQFGYNEKAAESLLQYLKSAPNLTDGVRATFVNELLQLWLDAKKPDELSETLSQFSSDLTTSQMENYIKQGLEIDKNNLNLRVLAEQALGWTVQQTAAQIGEKTGLDTTNQTRSGKGRQRESAVVADNAAAESKPKKPLITSTQFPANLLVKDDEKSALMGFMKPEMGYRLVKDRLAYDASVGYANKAIRQAEKPAALIIDALSLDYKNRNIEHFAQHLWRLYYTLGQYGRQVKERMLGWGLNLGEHPVFTALEANPNETQLKEIGISHGFLEKGVSASKAGRKALIQVRTDSAGMAQTAAEKILNDVESLLTYGQLDEAMDLLEASIVDHPQESQLYITLFDICERAEEWQRLEEVLHKIRANVQNPPEEVVLAMSQLLQKINYGSVRT